MNKEAKPISKIIWLGLIYYCLFEVFADLIFIGVELKDSFKALL
jgi:hypothetical protein